MTFIRAIALSLDSLVTQNRCGMLPEYIHIWLKILLEPFSVRTFCTGVQTQKYLVKC